MADNILLSKYLAHHGGRTRREAAALIKDGKVKVNGNVMKEPFYAVAESDVVTLNDKTISIVVTNVYYLINKPKDTSTSPKGDIVDLVSLVAKKTAAKVQSLDEMNEHDLGLVIVTNDPVLIERWETKRAVKSVWDITLTSDFKLDDKSKFPPSIKVLASEDIALEMLRIETHLSPTDIKSTLAKLKYKIAKMDRIQIGTITKKDLPRGWNRVLTEKEEIFVRYFS